MRTVRFTGTGFTGTGSDGYIRSVPVPYLRGQDGRRYGYGTGPSVYGIRSHPQTFLSSLRFQGCIKSDTVLMHILCASRILI